MQGPRTFRLASSSCLSSLDPRSITRRARPFSSSSIISPSFSPRSPTAASTRLFSSTSSVFTSDSSTSTLSNPYLPAPSQIFAVPFTKSPDDTWVLNMLKIGVKAQAALQSRSLLQGVLFALSASYPNLIRGKQPQLVDIRAIYVPAFAVNVNVEAVTSRGDLSLLSKRCFFPGTSALPLSQLHITPLIASLPSSLRKYDPSTDINQHDTDITPIPFDTSPLVLPSLLSASPFELGELGDIENPVKDLRWNRLEATPLYLPFYVAKFTVEENEVSLLYDASSREPGSCTLHFPSVKPMMKSPLPPRPLTTMVFVNNSPNAPRSRWDDPFFSFDLFPSQTGAGRGFISPASKLSSLMEGWLEKEGTREMLRRATLEGAKDGKEVVGKIGGW